MKHFTAATLIDCPASTLAERVRRRATSQMPAHACDRIARQHLGTRHFLDNQAVPAQDRSPWPVRGDPLDLAAPS